MHDSDWLKLKLRLIFLTCIQTQILCNGALVQTGEWYNPVLPTAKMLGITYMQPHFLTIFFKVS